MKKTIIIGGGVTGLSTAYHIARMEGGSVVVLEKDSIGSGSSGRAAGITTGLLWTETGVRARKLATRWFRTLSSELDGYTYHNEYGCLNLFNEETWPAREALLPLYEQMEAPFQLLSPEQIHTRWPLLNAPEGTVGLHDPLGGYSEPEEYLAGLTAKLRAMGVEIRENVTVRELVSEGGRISGVRTDSEFLRADNVVCCSYAWILPLLETLGLSLPAKTFVHQRFVSSPLPQPLRIPPVNADIYLGYIRPTFENRLLLGIETPEIPEFVVPSMDFSLDDLKTDPWTLLDDAVGRFTEFLPEVRGLKWESVRVGLLSFSVDGEPIVGPISGVEGLFVGVSFHSGGFSYNPASGRLLAEYVVQGKPSIDLTAFLPSRFERAETDDYLAQIIPQSKAVRRRH